MNDVSVPTWLKFFMNNVKGIINNQLTLEIYPLWKLQIMKLFMMNGFDDYLDRSTSKLDKHIIDDTGIVM